MGRQHKRMDWPVTESDSIKGNRQTGMEKDGKENVCGAVQQTKG